MSAAAPSRDAPPRRLLELLGRLRIVRDAQQHRALLQRLADPVAPTVLSFFNQHAFNLAWTDPAFAEDLRRSDVLLRDGVGVAACLRLLARDPGLNANGTDLIPQLLAAFGGRRAVLIGTREPYLQRAAQRLGEDYGIQVACALDGFGDAAAYLEAVARERPELVVLAMGMPRQERVAAELAQWARQAGHRLLIVNGGAIADFIAGRVARAPAWMRRARLEWLYRLGREPRRLWRRYLLGGVVFIARALRLAADPPPPAAGRAPLLEASTMKADTPALFGIDEARMTQLVQRLDASAGGGDGRIVQFVAARAGEGATALAHSYAAASAQLRRRRVLLLSDDAQGEVAGFPQVGAPAAPGLVLARLTDPQREFRDNYAALDEAAAWQALARDFDEVVVDAQAPYALAAARHASGVVVVVEAEATRAALVRKLLDELAAVDARVIGTVLNKYRSHLPHALHERL
ncbi:polymer biosynthesis protein, WecB/TagA/CpsF family [Lysobacter sp. yr284]|uniref:WecB/TagA/CpsF family glycosyltransferase n=1 Tax=Lysobacter sp. yr284 TaxID=1761791 RepID=UPI0008960612|nr:WecB/TagA/CpsF family glycosyltransferase [Lysobacter sp. yr284]SDY56375.1 polymer biosynthesis protein, WecB/TagA/CpsF family [Lysobacter sp. yr284]